MRLGGYAYSLVSRRPRPSDSPVEISPSLRRSASPGELCQTVPGTHHVNGVWSGAVGPEAGRVWWKHHRWIEWELSKEQMKGRNERSYLSCEQLRRSGEAVTGNHVWYKPKTRSLWWYNAATRHCKKQRLAPSWSRDSWQVDRLGTAGFDRPTWPGSPAMEPTMMQGSTQYNTMK
jgi:hypothetical protein